MSSKRPRDGATDTETGHQIWTLLAEQGGIDMLAQRCQTVSAWHSNNDLPLLWPIHANTRNLLFRLLELMDPIVDPRSQPPGPLAIVVRHRHARREDLILVFLRNDGKASSSNVGRPQSFSLMGEEGFSYRTTFGDLGSVVAHYVPANPLMITRPKGHPAAAV